MSQATEDKIYGLIVQAQEMQKFCLEFKGSAEEVVRSLPDATRSAVRDATREIIVEGTEKASRGLLEASRGATAAAAELHGAHDGALIRHSVYLFLVAVVICAGLWFGLGFMVERRAAELDELTNQARAMQATVEKLNSQYGKAQFSTCGGRPCIRVDERAGRYGESKKGESYYVLFNY